MPTGSVMLVAVTVAASYWGVSKTVDGVKKLNHNIASKFHHKVKDAPPSCNPCPFAK